MKFITDRKELAKAMNFGLYPVLKIDLADTDDYGLKGCRVRIDGGTFTSGSPHIIDARIRAYSDEKELTTSCSGSWLSDSFSYHDYFEMAENAYAPIIRPDQDVVVAIYDSKANRCYAALLVHTGPRVNPGCTTPLEFLDADMSPFFDVVKLFS